MSGREDTVEPSDQTVEAPKVAEATKDAIDETRSNDTEGADPTKHSGPQHATETNGTDARIRNEWDHSYRRVVVQNVYKYEDVRKMRKLTASWIEDIEKEKNVSLEITKVKKPPKDNWMVVTLKDERMVQPFIDYVNEKGLTNRKGTTLFAKPAKERNSFKRKRADGNSDQHVQGQRESKRQRLTDEVVQAARRPVTDDEIRDVITPLWRLSEEDQRSTKMKALVKRCALKILKEIQGRFRALSKDKSRKKKVELYDWLKKDRVVNVEEMISVPSPVRNKCEFTFGYRYLFDEAESGNAGDRSKTQTANRKVPSVGLMATGWAGGVVRPHVCANISSEACALVDLVNDFLSDSPLPPYDTRAHAGIWKTLTVRSSRRTRECMVIVTHSPASGGAGEKDSVVSYAESFDSEKTRLLSKLTKANLPIPDQEPIKVTSVFFQEYQGISSPSPEHPVQHAFGETALSEQIGLCKFRISPGAFFQVNTVGAELLFRKVVDKVREVCSEPQKVLLFDVCCGTGTIGLSCMKHGVVGQVVGVDISEPAIRDAEQNAKLNNLNVTDGDASSSRTHQKMKYVAARAEEVLSKEIGKAKETNLQFVAVVDPAREGLHADVLKTLRANQRIGRIVYVSCNPTGTLVRDAGLLCAPPTKRYSGRPFRVESACPVDMFPLTNHCEMVMTFDRLELNEENSTNDR